MTEELKDTSSLKNSITQQSDSNESIEQTLEDSENRRKEEGGFGVEKPISVIFAAIEGFEVDSNADMDMIEEKSIVKQQFDLELDNIITKYGGITDKIQGGFFMATFGTQVTNKDDPTCAVLAAMDMVKITDKFPDVDIHVGINSGVAWVGGIGTDQYTDTTVLGPTVNLAARIKAKAGPKQVVVSPSVYHLTKDIFVYQSLPAESFKGIAEPVPIFSVVDQKPEATRITAFKESEEERQKRLKAAIPPHLRDKIDKARLIVQGERKIVTILFSDLSGFTELSEKFKNEPSKMALLMDKCHHDLGKIVYKYEGIIDRIIGDALVAIFGAPIVHENDPERAVQAGLEMMDEIKRFSDRMAIEMDMPPLNVHIGVNTGRISIGNISTDQTQKMDYTVIGEPVELAEKLEDISETGEMLVGERTYRLTRALFKYEKKTDVEVRGQLIPVYRALGKRADPELKRGVSLLNKVFVSRETEIKALNEKSKMLWQNQGHFVGLIGQAGLGKSRLKRELRLNLGGRVTWLEGNCFEYTAQTAYSVFISAFTVYLDIQETDRDDEITEKLIYKIKNLFRESDEDLSDEIIPYIGSQLFALNFEGDYAEKVKYLDAEGRRRRTFAAIRDILIEESRRKPVTFVLEDLHWIDQVSLDLIFFLLGSIVDNSIFLIALYRPERTELCWHINDEIPSRIPNQSTLIELSQLSSQASRNLLEGLLTLINADSLKERIIENAEGNPFYMEEMLRLLIDNQVIQQIKIFNVDFSDQLQVQLDNGFMPEELLAGFRQNHIEFGSNFVVSIQEMGQLWRISNVEKTYIVRRLEKQIVVFQNQWATVGNADRIEIPDSLEQMLRARIDRMSSEPKSILQCCAVIGRTVDHAILEQISDDIADLDTNLGQLIALDMIDPQHSPSGQFEYVFEHIVTHNIAYSMVPVVTRRNLHTRIGDSVLLKNQDNPERVLEQLANHYHQGNDGSKALIHLAKAGRKAKQQYNHQVALKLYTQGLEHLGESSVDLLEEQIIIHEGLGDVYKIQGEFDTAIKHFEQAAQITGSALREAKIKRKIADVFEKRSEYETATEMLQQALEDLKDQPNLVEEATIYNSMGWIHSQKGDYTRAIDMATRALKLVEGTTAYDIIASINKNLGNYYFRKGDLEKTNLYFENGISQAERIGDKMLMAQLYNNLGLVENMIGKVESALDNYKKSIELKKQIGDNVGLTNSYSNLGSLYSTMNDFDASLKCHQNALEIAQRSGLRENIANVENNLGNFYFKQGDNNQATDHYLISLDIRKEIGNLPGLAEVYINLTGVNLKEGNLETAEKYSREGLRTAEEISVPQAIAHAWNKVGMVQQQKKDWREAIKSFSKAAEIADKANMTLEIAEANRCTGEVLIEMGNQDQAKTSLQKALEIYKKIKSIDNIELTQQSLSKLGKHLPN